MNRTWVNMIVNRVVFVGVSLIALLLAGVPVHAQAPYSGSNGADSSQDHVVIDDFESYRDGGLPVKWKYLMSRQLHPLEPVHMRPKEKFYVVKDGDESVLRVYTEGEAVHLTMANEPDGFSWDLKSHPYLQWRWKAHELPPGAREDKKSLNDTGAAVYVIFSIEGVILKRPQTIKYTYSSTLPVGTIVDFGSLKAIVASSGRDGIGSWRTIKRDVASDYRAAFGKEPPRNPLSIRLWGDSDDTESRATADFDDITLVGK
ncbi:MAG: DUF3047 domain-containing protein [Rhodothermia bacterium]|nr:DUF3047 domain-containing protein [Rhodothermia bacterium]